MSPIFVLVPSNRESGPPPFTSARRIHGSATSTGLPQAIAEYLAALAATAFTRLRPGCAGVVLADLKGELVIL